MKWPNVSHAFVNHLQQILTRGRSIRVRSSDTLELTNCLTELENPRQRCLVTPYRNASVFAAAAETMWVLAGRNDIAFLTPYLPSAVKYSDDGRTWRSGYGPRIRNWHGVDQLKSVADLLAAAQDSRRAVMIIFDPAQDYVESKDIPCNNWVHCLVRDGSLHMNVALRSNDVWFGFSGINAFEWSVIQEILAFWLQVKVGALTLFASSLHLYSDMHRDKAIKVVEAFPGFTGYDYGLQSSPFRTPEGEFARVLGEWFDMLEAARRDPDSTAATIDSFPDPLFRDFLHALRVFHGRERWAPGQLAAEVSLMPETDVTLSVYDFLRGREGRELAPDGVAHPRIEAYLHAVERATSPLDLSGPSIIAAIRGLHREKSAAYGDSWKRRGEVLGVLANLARKVDRLGGPAGIHLSTADESLVDTAADLLVYAIKYLTYLSDVSPAVAREEQLAAADAPYSDGTQGFEAILNRVDPAWLTEKVPVADAVAAVTAAFRALEHCFSLEGVAMREQPEVRAERGRALLRSAARMVAAAGDAHPGLLRSLALREDSQ